VREFIQDHIDKPLSAADLAAATGLSSSRFARAFKISFGVSPHQHLMKARIDRAKLLMLTTDDGLSSIASACGLSDQSHFSRLFQRFEGETPTSWRRRLGNAVTWQPTTNRAARLLS
jgi:AraC-like DNA-binding protein